jgi:hypothetical protein
VGTWLRALATAAVIALVACDSATVPPQPTPSAPASTPTGTVDCGSFDAGHGGYDAQGLDCFWTAYSTGKSARWSVKQLTIEGDPIPATITADGRGGLVVSRDFSADKFSSPANRHVFVWTCSTITRKLWPTDPARSFLELTGCTGAGASTTYP